jgi:hypothetical protein
MSIFNLTQHAATTEQLEVGVTEPTPEVKKEIQMLLTFEYIPSEYEMAHRAAQLAKIADLSTESDVMIGGAPFFMSALERALKNLGMRPLYAFSIRECVDKIQPNGEKIKTSVFRHVGFVGLLK